MGPLIVQKFGGTSLSTPEKIEKSAQIIQREISEDKKVIVVVSAMGSHTDELLNLAKKVHSTPPKRELDMLLSSGERVSMALLSMALKKIHVRAISLTGSQSGILTDHIHGNARILRLQTQRIKETLKTYDVIIIAGFQGVNPETKEITTLGRGGSDLSAVAIAATLKPLRCQIFTDVPGVLTAHPKIVSHPRRIPRLSWLHMQELAWSGAELLHHRSVFVAKKFGIPLEIRHYLAPHKIGTLICGETMLSPSQLEQSHVVAISHKADQTRLTLSWALPQENFEGHKILGNLLRWLWEREESPNPCYQICDSREDKGFRIELLLASSHVSSFINYLEDGSCAIPKPSQVTHSSSLTLITVIGQGFRQNPELISKMASLCPKTPVFLQVCDSTVALALPEELGSTTVRILHEAFFEAS